MRTLPLVAALVLGRAATALGEPPRVELPLGPWARAGHPLDVRVIGGADRVRGPGTPWALPMGDHGDEFVLQLAGAVSSPLEIVVERGGIAEPVRLPVEVLPRDGRVVALADDARAPSGAIAVRVPTSGLPSVASAWKIFDRMLRTADGSRDDGPVAARPFDPLLMAPDPDAFAAANEAALAGPRVDPSAAFALALLGVTEIVLVVILALRRDGPWRRAAWICLPAITAAVYVASSVPLAGALRAVPLAIDDGVETVVFVRIDAIRDGSGVLRLPPSALHRGPAALLRFSSDDRTVEDAEVGTEVRLTLRAGESRLVAYACDHEKGVFLLPWTAPAEAATPARVERWLAGHGLAPGLARWSVHPGSVPLGVGIHVLPGLEVDVSPAK